MVFCSDLIQPLYYPGVLVSSARFSIAGDKSAISTDRGTGESFIGFDLWVFVSSLAPACYGQQRGHEGKLILTVITSERQRTYRALLRKPSLRHPYLICAMGGHSVTNHFKIALWRHRPRALGRSVRVGRMRKFGFLGSHTLLDQLTLQGPYVRCPRTLSPCSFSRRLRRLCTMNMLSHRKNQR